MRRPTIALFLLALSCLPARAEEEGALPPVVKLDAAAAGNEGIAVTLSTPGTLAPVLPVISRVMPDTTRVVHIHPAGSGKVLAVLVQPGTHVARGQALLRYQDHSLHVARLQAVQMRAALTAAIAARSDAAAAVQRARALAGESISFAELRRRQDALAQADATMRARQADVDTLGHRFAEEFNSSSEQDSQGAEDETSTLISPVDGVVQAISTSVAGDVDPTMDVATVADLSSIWIVSDIAPDQAARIAPGGQQVTQTAGGPLVSRIDTVDGMASPLTGLVRVISRVANPTGALVPGMVLDATLAQRDSVAGIVVPSEAIQRIDGRSIVFVRASGTDYRPVVVDVALDDGTHAVLRGGLRGGEAVVGHGSFALRSVIGLAGMDAD
ncbi:efflux transporter periplasmic adaptor subunit [Komagataeibacter rhaeticus]|uniref:efflux RND transporter periplasmic adaptor subunit n=1 Tax=Komagataeibacter rhaeticus TaxID=215221 RepID=UPI0004D3B5EB|nr:efflux RND transporter periplasmic adaptor subunit [Komagataeibacter rhaeticus]KDU96555.1 heat-shock protein HtpX [Komagataeibacter rhaeticus AF1]MBL7240939.1 efflux RND transporter periplasmic adaptor subunit [Komagataeibacter rhaeticus]PYD52985.1 efflux transporter periplasmic adaptor subunit [Komagataeibacter rhaeticus]GBQ09117.1 heavy metal/cation efflux pump CzcB/HlyD [Komagataeibacter rhaeticus DSM 16663]